MGDRHHHHHHPRARLAAGDLRPPEPPLDPLEFLSRSWSASAVDVPRPRPPSPAPLLAAPIAEDPACCELDDGAATAGSSFSFASAATSQFIMERILAQSEVAPLTSGRLSHSSGPLNGGGSLTDSPPVSPEIDDSQYCRAGTPKPQAYRGGSKTVGRWLKDRKEKKKEETRAHNAQVHAAVSVAAVAAAIAAVAAATAAASGSGKDDRAARTDMAMASAATLVAAQCVEAAESLGAEREHLEAVVSSAVNVRTPGDIVTVTAAAATALRGAATLRARALKEVWNIAAVIPVEKGTMGGGGGGGGREGTITSRMCKSSIASWRATAAASAIFHSRRRTTSWACAAKNSLFVAPSSLNARGKVSLKMKSRHVAGTITKKKKGVVIDVCKDVAAWPGRHLLEDGEQRRYFGLRTADHRVIEFECTSQREYELWTKGVARLLSIAGERKRPL
ncbi:hypothetical protein ZWY2020_017366 [Hordeum vulgare]|nr:hypothetical protein ZWY2020_017366 [Hordeum vulgare]